MRTVKTIAVFVLGLTSVVCAQVPNDLCASATPVFDGVNPGAPSGIPGSFFTNAGAGTEGTASCSPTPTVKDVWFIYQATASGIVVSKLCTPTGFTPGTSGGFVLSVLSSCVGTELACVQIPSVPFCQSPVSVQAAFSATAGTSYLIRVATEGLDSTFYLTIVPPAPPPPNDACANATPVFNGSNPATGTFSNAGATQDGFSTCGPPLTGPVPDVWFSYTATATGVATFSTTSFLLPGSLSARLTVLSACGGAQLACGDPATATATVTAGATYILHVAPAFGQGIMGPFYVSVVAPVTPHPHDECFGALPIFLGANGPFSNAGATASPGLAPGSTDLWYSFTTGSCPGSVSIDTCPFVFLGSVSIHGFCGGPAIGEFDPSSGCAGGRVTFYASALTTYFVRVAGGASLTAPYFLNVSMGSVLIVSFSSPSGPGCVQADVGGIPLGGNYGFAVTLNAGAFPSGPFFGLSILPSEIIALITIGPPFLGAADSCGNAKIGQFCAALSGLTVYAVALAFGPGVPYGLPPTRSSLPVSYTIP